MSNSSIELAMKRIEAANPKSQIAVFKCHAKLGAPTQVNSMFASTVLTQNLIENNHPDLIGVYDGTMDKRMVKAEIRSKA